jgi:hypothetical protein
MLEAINDIRLLKSLKVMVAERCLIPVILSFGEAEI